MPAHPRWTPFRPGPADLQRIAGEVAPVRDIQSRLRERHPDLQAPDRVAHQYQIAGGRVELRVDEGVPDPLQGVGLFVPGARHVGIGRVSTGLGCPHLETDPDFLGLMLAFHTASGRRVDFLGLNDPAAPTDDHRSFVELLAATADSAGTEVPFGGVGERDLVDLAATQTRFAASLVKRLGLRRGLAGLGHILVQTQRTLLSSSAYQTYWTGVVEVEGTAGKFVFTPGRGGKPSHPGLRPGERHLTEDWRRRQAEDPLTFRMSWIPYLDEGRTPLDKLTEGWTEERRPVGTVTFPRTDPDSDEARAWASLASEMGANPGHWVHDRGDTVAHPATEFGVARSIAYGGSQQGRGALPEELYRSVFETGRIGPELAEELRRRRAAKEEAGHVSWSPAAPHP
ncbi:MAG TPA: hypothetical protein VE173_12740 [Longimicrobiales bacterium]|nr:hypothetical protein [Longimicrobiales bacterium]